MGKAGVHVIQKVNINLEFNNEQRAFKTQKTFLDSLGKLIQNELQSILDNRIPPGEYLKIDSLVIDLGRLQWDSLSEELSRLFPQKFSQELEKAVNICYSNQNTLRTAKRSHGDLGNRSISNTSRLWEWLEYFLSTGLFPWWASSDFSELEKQFHKVLVKKGYAFAEKIPALLAKKPSSLQRFSRQFSWELQLSLIDILFKAKSGTVDKVFKIFQSFSLKQIRSPKPHNFLERIWDSFSQLNVFEKTLDVCLENLIVLFIQSLEKPVSTNQLSSILHEFENLEIEINRTRITAQLSHNKRIQKNLKRDRENAVSGEDAPGKTISSPSDVIMNEKQHGITDPLLSEKTKNTDKKQKDEKKTYTKADMSHAKDKGFEDKTFPSSLMPEKPAFAFKEGEFHYVQNAGLVLFAPFLTSFFKELDLLENNIFKNQNAQIKGAHTLQYLVDPGENTPENEMLLNKVLCGLPPDFPLHRHVPLSETDIMNCIDLLHSVLKHWTALKSSSIEALREGFLRRDGKLTYKTSGWKLIVDRKTLDVLMSSLPWGFSIIKLPWLKELVHVEW